MAQIFVIMGKSSSGKDTIFSRLVGQADCGLKTVTMYTTRPMRDGEADGREYFFTDEEHCAQYEKQGRIVELRAYNTVYGVWKYFTVDDGQIDMESDESYIIIGTLEAYDKIRNYYGKDRVHPIYIEVDAKTRIHRALAREDSQKNPKYAEMCRRFLADEEDFSDEKIAALDIGIRFENDNLDMCIDKIRAYIADVIN